MDFETYESAFNNDKEPSELPKSKPLKKYDESLFDPDLYGCWMVPKWTPEGQAEAVAFRRAKIEKVPKVKILKVAVKKSEIKGRVLEMKNGAGRAKAAFLSFLFAAMLASCGPSTPISSRPFIVAVSSSEPLGDSRIECDSFNFIPKNCQFGEGCQFCPARVRIWVDGRDMIIEGNEIMVHSSNLFRQW